MGNLGKFRIYPLWGLSFVPRPDEYLQLQGRAGYGASLDGMVTPPILMVSFCSHPFLL